MATKSIQERLAEPFPPDVVKWLPRVVAKDGASALGIPYIDARTVQDRLDTVLGLGWQTDLDFLPNGSVMCTLRIHNGTEWITRKDIGSPSEQPDEGDRLKAAVSDSLKRAAVQFGIGRYLYSIKPVWAPYDSQRKQWKTQPQVPAEFRPREDMSKAFKAVTEAIGRGTTLAVLEKYQAAYRSTDKGFSSEQVAELDKLVSARLEALVKARQDIIDSLKVRLEKAVSREEITAVWNEYNPPEKGFTTEEKAELDAVAKVRWQQVPKPVSAMAGVVA